jgi:plasmid stabilization system protein ParE
VFIRKPGWKLRPRPTGTSSVVRDASVGFIAAVFDALESITEAPQRWPEYLHGTRRFVLHRFPFSTIYFNDPDIVNIVAVAHNKRKPGYWKRRL